MGWLIKKGFSTPNRIRMGKDLLPGSAWMHKNYPRYVDAGNEWCPPRTSDPHLFWLHVAHFGRIRYSSYAISAQKRPVPTFPFLILSRSRSANRMQINTDKTKIMAFFETPALLRARGGQHQPSPTMPAFHVYSPFPISDPRSYPILEVSQFEYLGLILDPKLNYAPRNCGNLAVSYSLRYDKNSSQLTPTQNLGLWKSIVLPHFLDRGSRCLWIWTQKCCTKKQYG